MSERNFFDKIKNESIFKMNVILLSQSIILLIIRYKFKINNDKKFVFYGDKNRF